MRMILTRSTSFNPYLSVWSQKDVKSMLKQNDITTFWLQTDVVMLYQESQYGPRNHGYSTHIYIYNLNTMPSSVHINWGDNNDNSDSVYSSSSSNNNNNNHNIINDNDKRKLY